MSNFNLTNKLRKSSRAYDRRLLASKRRKKLAANSFELEVKQTETSLAGKGLAFCLFIAGTCLFAFAWHNHSFYAPVRRSATSYLNGVIQKELKETHTSGQNPVRVRIDEIQVKEDRAIINATLSMPGNWVKAELLAHKKSGYWEIVGVTGLDSHVENVEDQQMATQIETAFESSPEIEVKRY